MKHIYLIFVSVLVAAFGNMLLAESWPEAGNCWLPEYTDCCANLGKVEQSCYQNPGCDVLQIISNEAMNNRRIACVWEQGYTSSGNTKPCVCRCKVATSCVPCQYGPEQVDSSYGYLFDSGGSFNCNGMASCW